MHAKQKNLKLPLSLIQPINWLIPIHEMMKLTLFLFLAQMILLTLTLPTLPLYFTE